MTHRITVKKSTGKDYERICIWLDRYNAEKKAKYAPSQFIFRVDDEKGKMIAGAMVKELWGVWEVDVIAASDATRGQGAGKALMVRIEKEARKRKIKSIWLWTMSWQGVGFYERCGFIEMGRIPALLKTRARKKDFRIFYQKILKSKP